MDKNEANWERIARTVLGVVMVIVGFAMGGIGGVIVGLIGLIPLVTGLVGFCPIYKLINFKTN